MLKEGVTNGVTKTNVEMFDRHVIYIVFVYFRQLKRSCIYFLIFCSGRRLVLLSEQWIEIFFLKAVNPAEFFLFCCCAKLAGWDTGRPSLLCESCNSHFPLPGLSVARVSTMAARSITPKETAATQARSDIIIHQYTHDQLIINN